MLPLNTSIKCRVRWRGLGGMFPGPMVHPRKCTPGRPSVHGGLAGPPLVTVAGPLLAPHFLNPGFLGLGVGLACGEKGGLRVLAPSQRPPQEDQPFLRTHLPHRAPVFRAGSERGGAGESSACSQARLPGAHLSTCHPPGATLTIYFKYDGFLRHQSAFFLLFTTNMSFSL